MRRRKNYPWKHRNIRCHTVAWDGTIWHRMRAAAGGAEVNEHPKTTIPEFPVI
jgi:hypothetical protein